MSYYIISRSTRVSQKFCNILVLWGTVQQLWMLLRRSWRWQITLDYQLLSSPDIVYWGWRDNNFLCIKISFPSLITRWLHKGKSGTANIYTHTQGDTESSVNCFFVLFSWDWYWAKAKHLIISVSSSMRLVLVNSKHLHISASLFFNKRAFVRHPFFLFLGSYQFLTFLHTSVFLSWDI